MIINYKKILKYVWKFENKKYIRISLYVCILSTLLYNYNYNKPNIDLNFLPTKNIYLEENPKELEEKKISLDFLNFFSSLDNLKQNNFIKKDFYFHYYPFTIEEERKELSLLSNAFFMNLIGETNLLTNDSGYILTDENNKISQLELNIQDNVFYNQLNTILKEYINNKEKDKYLLYFNNNYDNLIYVIKFDHSNYDIEVIQKENQKINIIKKLTISNDQIYYENKNSYAYNRINYNENIESYKEIEKNYFDEIYKLKLFIIIAFIIMFEFFIFPLKKGLFLLMKKQNKNKLKNIKISLKEGIFNEKL